MANTQHTNINDCRILSWSLVVLLACATNKPIGQNDPRLDSTMRSFMSLGASHEESVCGAKPSHWSMTIHGEHMTLSAAPEDGEKPAPQPDHHENEEQSHDHDHDHKHEHSEKPEEDKKQSDVSSPEHTHTFEWELTMMMEKIKTSSWKFQRAKNSPPFGVWQYEVPAQTWNREEIFSGKELVRNIRVELAEDLTSWKISWLLYRPLKKTYGYCVVDAPVEAELEEDGHIHIHIYEEKEGKRLELWKEAQEPSPHEGHSH